MRAQGEGPPREGPEGQVSGWLPWGQIANEKVPYIYIYTYIYIYIYVLTPKEGSVLVALSDPEGGAEKVAADTAPNEKPWWWWWSSGGSDDTKNRHQQHTTHLFTAALLRLESDAANSRDQLVFIEDDLERIERMYLRMKSGI